MPTSSKNSYPNWQIFYLDVPAINVVVRLWKTCMQHPIRTSKFMQPSSPKFVPWIKCCTISFSYCIDCPFYLEKTCCTDINKCCTAYNKCSTASSIFMRSIKNQSIKLCPPTRILPKNLCPPFWYSACYLAFSKIFKGFSSSLQINFSSLALLFTKNPLFGMWTMN